MRVINGASGWSGSLPNNRKPRYSEVTATSSSSSAWMLRPVGAEHCPTSVSHRDDIVRPGLAFLSTVHPLSPSSFTACRARIRYRRAVESVRQRPDRLAAVTPVCFPRQRKERLDGRRNFRKNKREGGAKTRISNSGPYKPNITYR